jgi:predicted transposase YbfD/YdcC
VAGKSNEITAIPDRLALLDLHGAVVSIDALGCQKAIARQIADAGADYVLALKDNHPTWREDVRLWLDTEVGRGRLPVQDTVEKDHGRIETRRQALSAQIDWLEAKPDWAGLQAVGRVKSPGSSARKPAPNAATSCARSRSGTGSRPPSATIGPSRTPSTGSWTCHSARIPAALGRITPRKTWP